MKFEFLRPQDSADWWTLVLAAIFTVIVIVGPIYVSSQVTEDTDLIISVLERQAEEARTRAIQVNVLTLSCIFNLPIEERTNEALSECISEGLTVPTTPPDTRP